MVLKTKHKIPPDIKIAVYSFVKGQIRRLQAVDENKSAMADDKIIAAVQQAYDEIGEDIRNTELREALQQGIWLNIIDRKKHTYRYMNLPGIGKKKFYEEKNQFVYTVAKNMDYI